MYKYDVNAIIQVEFIKLEGIKISVLYYKSTFVVVVYCTYEKNLL